MQTNVALMPQRPPYVEFEQRAMEDRTETIKQNRLVMKDVDFAIIRAIGAKDAVEKLAEEWLTHIEKQAAQGSYPREWAQFFRQLYKDWKAGHEAPVNGTHVKNWPGISKAQCETLIACRVITVEDLAAANEETLQRIGMGARALQSRARAWLDTVEANGSAEELAALRQQTTDQTAQIAELHARIDQLVAQLQATEPESGRKRKAS